MQVTTTVASDLEEPSVQENQAQFNQVPHSASRAQLRCWLCCTLPCSFPLPGALIVLVVPDGNACSCHGQVSLQLQAMRKATERMMFKQLEMSQAYNELGVQMQQHAAREVPGTASNIMLLRSM